MDPTGVIYLALVAVAYGFAARSSRPRAVKSLQAGGKSLMGMLSTFAAVFALVGLFEVFLPVSLIQRWMGATNGAWSLLSGAGVGAIAAGPPPAAFPIAATLLKGGAWMPAVGAFIVSWILVGIASLPFEAKMFGWRFALLRNGLSFLAAMAIGLVMGWVL